ncbi:MAG: hypothetical protein HY700_00090 [Gemmatimonadetes bacterium]|nr:hypothetical protein [Gemmatimonadota bacterium]
MRHSRLTAIAALALLSLAASCKKDNGPVAGNLAADLLTPNSDDGAIQFTATATVPNTITGLSSACAGCKLFIVKVSDTQYKGVVTGNIAAGTLFQLGVSDTKLPTSYSVKIDNASSRTFVVRGSSGYSATLK